MPVARRNLLAGIAASLVPMRASVAAPALHAALDAAAAADPAAGLAMLAGFDPSRLTETARRDLLAARGGLAIDAAIARLLPGPRRNGRPYRVTASGGAWKSAMPRAAAIDAETAAIVADGAIGIVLPRTALTAACTAISTAARSASPEIAAALSRQVAALTALSTRSPSAPGLAALPHGRRWYHLLVQRPLGPAPAPASIERRLHAELHDLHRRADRRFAQIGMPAGTIGQRYTLLWRDPRWHHADDDRGRAQAVDAMNRTLSQMKAALPATLGAVPDWCTDVSARSLSAADLAAGRGGYREIPAPGRPGAYVVDLRDIRRRPSWSLPAVVAHELLPGHMLQLGLEAQIPPHPLRLEYASAFVEGWAIHAEHDAGLDGAFDDPRVDLGHIHWLIFRVARALVDLGIHLHGWSVDHARAQWTAWQGEPAYFASFASELARIPLEPGTRVAECLAWLGITDRLRGGDPQARSRHLLVHGRERIGSA